MRELVRLIEEPRPCSYLPEEAASLEYRIVQQLGAGEYEGLLARGYRRFGRQLFRPRCAACRKCVSIRFCASEFSPSASLRRVLRRNEHIEIRHEPVYMTERHLQLYQRYHEFMSKQRGWKVDPISGPEYYDSFLAGGDDFASQWLYYDRGLLVGVALMDETPNALSLVYFFHEPEWRPQSPGVFSILTQLEYARTKKKKYAYPGYWIESNASMAYKSRFKPFETLLGSPEDWQPVRWTPQEASGRERPAEVAV